MGFIFVLFFYGSNILNFVFLCSFSLPKRSFGSFPPKGNYPTFSLFERKSFKKKQTNVPLDRRCARDTHHAKPGETPFPILESAHFVHTVLWKKKAQTVSLCFARGAQTGLFLPQSIISFPYRLVYIANPYFPVKPFRQRTDEQDRSRKKSDQSTQDKFVKTVGN